MKKNNGSIGVCGYFNHDVVFWNDVGYFCAVAYA